MSAKGSSGLAALAVTLLLATPITAQDTIDDLGGFDDDETEAPSAPPAPPPEAATSGGEGRTERFEDGTYESQGDLGGFDDTPAEDLGDLGGFEDDAEDYSRSAPVVDRWWDIDGSLGLSTSWSYLYHRSVAPPPNGTSFTGLVRMRTRLDLEFDFELPRDFEIRISPYAWYDFAYIIRGIEEFTRQVIDKYEWEVDVLDAYLQGPLLENVDIKIGRQVVNWGRSDSLRVLDVLNPLDNREPGRADIENLRWPIGMVKLDGYFGKWTVTGIAIPEFRPDDLPPVGSDFNPSPISLPRREPNSFQDWEWAAAIGGIFEGWDFSVHWAYLFEDQPRLKPDLVFEFERFHLIGVGTNYTLGSWLFKAEGAWVDGLRFTTLEPGVGLQVTPKKTRADAMVGVEYYGISDTTIAIEAVNRHTFEYEGTTLAFPTFLRQNATEYAVRITTDWMNQRLSTTVLALMFGWKLQDGVVIRAEGQYTLRDGLVVTGGILMFKDGNLPVLSSYGSNDRVFVDIKYSF